MKRRDGFKVSTSCAMRWDNACVAVKRKPDGSVSIKDTKTNKVLTFDKNEWGDFIDGVKKGEFD